MIWGKNTKQYFNQQMGRRSIMIWGAFNHDALCDLTRILERMNSAQHHSMLYDFLIPFRPILGGSNWIFWRYNASYHISKSTQPWIKKEKNHVLSQPIWNPDLNPMKNLCCVLRRKIYTNNKWFLSTNELEIVIVIE